MSKKIMKWAVIGPGGIAERFALSMQKVEDAEIWAVASRNKSRAEHYAQRFSIPHVCSSYEELWARNDIDVVYIATPHVFHYDQALKSLESGTAVMCEKPLTLNAAASKTLFEHAAKHNAFLMEAMWSPFLPAIKKVKHWVDEGRVGDIQMIQSTFGIEAPKDPSGRWFNKDLAGGVTLDASIYNIALSNWFLNNTPIHIAAQGHIGMSGVDESVSVTMDYGKGQFSQYQTSFTTRLPNEMSIVGSDGRILIGGSFWATGNAELFSGDEYERFDSEVSDCGFEYEIQHVNDCVRSNKLVSDIITPEFTCELASIMDTVLAQLNLKFE